LGQPAYDGSRPAAYGAPAPPQHYQPPPQHLQPFVADDSERRTPDYLAGQAAEHAYRPPPSMPSGPVVTTYPEEYAAQNPLPGHAGYRRGSVASSKSGYGDAAARSTPTERYHSGARVAAPRPTAAAAAGSQYVEFGYTSPAMATLENSPPPEDDEIADIIADMTKTRITADGSPIRVFLQLGDDTKRVELADEPTHTTLVNLFIDKYRGRLADDPEALPAVYVKDRKAGVFYELEDMADVVDGAVLSWRTKPLAKGDGGGSAGDSSAEDAPKEQARDELAAVVAALAETVAQLPAKLKAEMASAAESAQGAMRAAAEAAAVAAAAAKAEEPASAAAEPQPAAAIARSASMPATGDTRDGSGLRRRAEKAEMELGVERQLRREADAEAAAEKARLAAELEKLRAEVGQHPNVLRARIEEGKAELRAKYRAFNAGFEDVDSMVQEMRKDVTQRGSIPSNQMVRKASTQLKEI
ncbi:Bud site selection protein 6, partial [Coemansia helicoidea]